MPRKNSDKQKISKNISFELILSNINAKNKIKRVFEITCDNINNLVFS